MLKIVLTVVLAVMIVVLEYVGDFGKDQKWKMVW